MFIYAVAADGFAAPGFVERLRARDEQALHELMDEYLPQIYRAARGAGLNEHDAEDATQNTFVTFMEKIPTFAGRSHVRTWLFGILYHKISESRRVVGRREETRDIDSVMEQRFRADGFWASPPRASDSEAFAAEIRRHLEECLEGVSTDQRLAFLLKEIEQMDSREICEAMDIERSNLGVLLFRGRNRLRECLESRDVTPGSEG